MIVDTIGRSMAKSTMPSPARSVRDTVLCVALVLGAFHMLTQSASAQTGRTNASSVMTPHWTPRDTARMTWGHTDYTRYTTADACDRAVKSVEQEVLRTQVQDTLVYSLQGDTISTAARVVAQTCGTRFTVTTTDPRELWSVLRLGLVLRDDAQVRAALAQLRVRERASRGEGETLTRAIEYAVKASPPRMDLAREWLRQLEAMGEAQRVARYEAWLTLLPYWHRMYDADSLRASADTALALGRKLNHMERETVDMLAPYSERFWLANMTQDLATQQQIVDSGLAQLGSWQQGWGAQWFTSMSHTLQTQRTLYGKATRPLQGKYWFHDGGTGRPVAGTMSLLVHVDPMCGTSCFSQYAVLRQLHAKYGAALDLTLIADMHGFSPGSGPLGTDDEAKETARYFLEFLALPAALLVDEVPVTRKPDGRIDRGTSPIGQMFAAWQFANAILVDRSGKVQWLGSVQSSDDARMVGAAIERVRAM